MQHQVGSNLLQHQVGSNSPGHSLLNLALLFLLVTAPDFGTFDPVLVSLHPLNGREVSWKIERGPIVDYRPALMVLTEAVWAEDEAAL